jgi:hypothetical protein
MYISYTYTVHLREKKNLTKIYVGHAKGKGGGNIGVEMSGGKYEKGGDMKREGREWVQGEKRGRRNPLFSPSPHPSPSALQSLEKY